MANLRICEGGLRWCYIFIRLLMANGPLMVRAPVAFVMQILIISLIKASEGGKSGEWVELTLTELHVLTATRQGFSRPSQTGDLGLRGIWLVCERLDGLGDWGWAFESVTQVTYIAQENIILSKPQTTYKILISITLQRKLTESISIPMAHIQYIKLAPYQSVPIKASLFYSLSMIFWRVRSNYHKKTNCSPILFISFHVHHCHLDLCKKKTQTTGEMGSMSWTTTNKQND